VERVRVVSRILPCELANPPEDAPEGADRMLWLLAWSLHSEHQPGPDGLCLAGSCGGANPEPFPCPASKLAQAGFLVATWHLRTPVDTEPLLYRKRSEYPKLHDPPVPPSHGWPP
jgi:hypothetical protein